MPRLAIAFLLLPLVMSAQQKDKDNLRSYINCQFSGKYQIEESMEKAEPFMRTVDTMDGKDAVEVVHGWSLHIAYDGTPFVNFKVERLGKSNYLRDKKKLISSLEAAAAHTAGMESNKPRQSALNDFEVYSINRKQLEGGVLSIYLLFRDSEQIVVSLYLLNTPPETPKFKNIEEYYSLREAFLNSYTACASKNAKQ
jgi:hypothetical protein